MDEPFIAAELQAIPELVVDAAGVARPGDTLIVHVDGRVTREQASMIREDVLGRIPGLADVLILTCTGTTIYRPDPT
jgi:hypothetical protein